MYPFTAYHHRTKAGYGAKTSTRTPTLWVETLATAWGPTTATRKQPRNGSFEEWGDAEALKNRNIKTWELGGFTYKQDPFKVLYSPVPPCT